jgi:hypothetical protein
MADYYPLLAKAVSGLKTSTPEARGAIYDRARKALLGQLRSMQPPAPESAIEREAKALDEAVARLELEFHPAPTQQPLAPPAPDEEAPRDNETSEEATVDEAPSGPSAREAQRPAAPKPDLKERGGLRRAALMVGGIALVVGLVGVAAWKLRDNPEDLARLVPAPEAADPKAGGKIGERIGADNGSARVATPANGGAGSPIIPVAYRAAILMQAPNEPGGVKTYIGSVVWRRDSTNRGPNQQLANAVRADVEVPDAHFKMSMLIEKNFESALSMSHTMTIRFMSADAPVGAVNQINVPEMRRDDAPKGAPLQGLPVDIAPNVFLVGLASSAEQQNIDMIRTLNWFDLPMSLANGRVAKVTFEKGPAGDKILNDVLAEWKAQ